MSYRTSSYTASVRCGYPRGMDPVTVPKLTVEEVNARMGWTITEEGKDRARRRRLVSAAAHHDPEGRAAFLESLRARPAS